MCSLPRTGDGAVKVLQEDIVVAAGLHLGKLQPLPLRAQVADIHQLGVTLVIAAGQDIRRGAGRVQRGQTGDSQLDAAVVQMDEIPRGRSKSLTLGRKSPAWFGSFPIVGSICIVVLSLFHLKRPPNWGCPITKRGRTISTATF